MSIKNYLTQEEHQTLQHELKYHDNPDIRERILMLLLRNDGKSYQEIADFLGCSLRKVAYWCTHGDPNKLESLVDERMKGNHHKATPEYIKLLTELIDKEPKELGYEFGRWTAKRLATHLEKETGIDLSSSQIRRILKKSKFVYIWSKYSLEDKQDPVKRTLFKEKLNEYIKISEESPELLQIWFWDESGFNLKPIRGKNWTKKGHRRKVSGRRRRGHTNVMGGLRLSDKKRYVDFLKKGTGKSFYEVLILFYRYLKYEWAGEDKNVEDFEKIGCKIVLVIDNASIHKTKEFLQKIQEEMPNLILEFLPEYSPDYNLIELVWHSAKEFIANRFFNSIEELEALLNRLINEGEMVINWERNIKNKGNLVNAV